MNLLLLVLTLSLLPYPYRVPVKVVGTHYASEDLSRFAEWAYHEMGFESSVYILITFTEDLPDQVAGYTLYKQKELKQGVIHQFMIRLDGRQHRGGLRSILAHELIHVRQIMEGKLILEENNHVRWEEKKFRWPYWGPHDHRPWEKEANGLSSDLVAIYRKSIT